MDIYNLILYKYSYFFEKTKTCSVMHNLSIRPAYCVAVNVLFSSPNLTKSENGAGLRRC